MMEYIYVTFIGLYFYILDVRWLDIQDQSLCDTINWWFYFFHLKLTGKKLKIKLDKYEKF